MPVIIRCPNVSCGQRLRLPRDFGSARCPRCGKMFNKPAAAPEPLPARAAVTDRLMSFGQLPREVALQLEDVCCRFEGDWTAGRRPRLEDYLGASEVPEHRILLRELILLDVHYRRQAGEVLRAGDYAVRFPGLEAVWLADHVEEAATVGPEPGPARATDPYETHSQVQPDETVPPDPQGSGADSQATFPGYEILGTLGRGGMGVVYKARDLKLKRIVALKMILAGAHAGERELGRFKAEAEAIARLQHPNIVQIHEVGEHDGQPFISLEFCTGGSLDRKLGGTPLPPREGAKLVATLARAMHAAHEARVVHRDLKPANVLLTADGTPKITDFGLAKKLDDVGQTQSGAIMGTPSYMAPEQAGGKAKDLGPSADIYALGAILYELLTGRPPFKAATPLDTVLQVVSDEPVAPTQLQSRTPRDLETICLKCLRKEPAKRYGSAVELADDLERYLRGEPILARPVGRGERVAKWVKRNPAVSSLVTAVAASLVLGTAIAWAFALQAENNATLTLKALGAEQQAKEGLVRALYFQRIASAQGELETNSVGRAEELLEECPFQLRGWEWHYLKRRRYQEPFTFRGHSSWVTAAAFSPDGKRVASASSVLNKGVGEIKVWERATGRVVLLIPFGHAGPVGGVAFSPDGKRLASAGWDKTVKIWDCATGKLLHTLAGHGEYVAGVAFSPDGKLLASGSGDRTAKLWDTAGFQELRTLRGHRVGLYGLAFSPDSTRLATGSGDRTVRVWDTATGRELHVLEGHAGPVLSVAYGPDGRRLASAAADGTVKLWDPAAGRHVRTIRANLGITTGVAFSPDGLRLATADWEKTVKVWDLVSDREALTLRGHTDWVTNVTFSPDGLQIASASLDNTVKVWDATPLAARVGAQLFTLRGHHDPVTGVAYQPGGNLLASASIDHTVKLWDATTGAEVRTLTAHVSPLADVAFSRDGSRLASADIAGVVKIWDAATGQEIHSFRGFSVRVALSPDGRHLASALEGAWVYVWDAATGKEQLRPFRAHYAPVMCLAFSPDGRRLATGSWDSTVKIWDTATGKELFTLRGHNHVIQGLTFSPDGQRLATASWDKTAKVWDALTGKELLTLRGHQDRVLSVAFSPNGKRLATASWDNMVKIWDGKGKEIASLRGDLGWNVAFSPDGKRLATAGGNRGKGEVRIWDATQWDDKRQDK